MAGAKSVGVAITAAVTLWEKRQTGHALTKSQQKQLEALDALKGRGKNKDDGVQPHAADETRIRQRAASLVQPLIQAEQDAIVVVAAHVPSAPLGYVEAQRCAPDIDHVELKRSVRDAVLGRMLAGVTDRNARSSIVDAGLNLSRDTVVQGALVGSRIAQTLSGHTLAKLRRRPCARWARRRPKRSSPPCRAS